MRNKAFRTNGKQGIVRSGEFGNGPLPIGQSVNELQYSKAVRIRKRRLHMPHPAAQVCADDQPISLHFTQMRGGYVATETAWSKTSCFIGTWNYMRLFSRIRSVPQHKPRGCGRYTIRVVSRLWRPGGNLPGLL
jgi:hypothetical protein